MTSDKRYLHHTWRRLKPINAWVFLGLAVLFTAIGVYAMRQNNLEAIRLRDQVIEADKNDADVETPLRNLREHIYSHMNTDLSSGSGVQFPVQLKYRYDRLVAAEKARVAGNGDLYTQAQTECERQFPAGVSGGGRVACIEQFVTARGGVTENPIPDSLYKFDFTSPRWTPDIAGISLLLSLIFLILFVVRFTLEKWLQRRLKAHQ